jgi:alanine-glyoxylate transaminase/serine-glyoxylate transaminase/serine-pyruvate transaminase
VVTANVVRRDIVVAGGLLKGKATEYFRIGHMGITAVDAGRGDIEKVLKGIKEVLDEAGFKKA